MFVYSKNEKGHGDQTHEFFKNTVSVPGRGPLRSPAVTKRPLGDSADPAVVGVS